MLAEKEKHYEIKRHALIYGFYIQKGVIRMVQMQTYLVIVTIINQETVDIAIVTKLHSKTRVTPFDGWRLKDVPVCAMISGEFVMDEGTIAERPSCGKLLSLKGEDPHEAFYCFRGLFIPTSLRALTTSEIILLQYFLR